ncbi:hypothetical protein [Natronoflexus pectinivorans]|uniref:Uncharacterized protein n=1 Tax=Natronoflexus pectinivorans TaxID=682526 RepID=A0A4R2GIF8_9BACT|nr:hypothetical protein [Natronoflexus pectinivorans]TCO08350.1 hypothetical protein EV194_105154 [Natronoflexus pectinivorans]
MDRITDFWIRNRTFIISILAFLLFMNLCGRIMLPPAEQRTEIRKEPQIQTKPSDDGLIYRDDRLNRRAVEQTERNRSFMSLLFWLTALALTGYYLYRKGWLAKLLPQWVSFTASLTYQKDEERLLITLVISNRTRESRTFREPELVFKRWFRSRKFKIKNSLFPLTLMPGTSHSLTISVDQFYKKIPELKGFNRIGATIVCDNKRTYRTKTLHKWFVKKE